MAALPLPRDREDLLPPALLGALGVVEVLTAGDATVQGPRAVLATTLVLAVLTLSWRRRAPVSVLVVCCALFLAPALVWGSSQLTAGVLVLVVAVFACGRYGRRPWAYVGLGVGTAAALALTALDPGNGSLADTWTWSLNSAWIFALGAWLRQKQRLIDTTAAEAVERSRATAAEERVHVARELHDVLAHSLTVMVVQAEAADAVLDTDPVVARRALGSIAGSGRAALAEVRAVLALLDAGGEVGQRAVALPEQRSARAWQDDLTDVVERMRSAGLPVTLTAPERLDDVPDDVGRTLQRLVQEALTNTLRHAGPADTRVVLELEAGAVRVTVVDAGGTPAHGVVGTGKGLVGMRERVERLGGSFAARPADGGFAVHATLPLPAGSPT